MGQGEARARWEHAVMKRERKQEKARRRKDPLSFSLLPSGTVKHIAETRKTSHTKNALLPGSLESFSLKARSKTGSLFRLLLENRREGERTLDGGQGSSSLSFLLIPRCTTFFVTRGKTLSRFFVVVPSDFPRQRGSASMQKEIYLFPLCSEESSIRANRTEKIDENNARVKRN